MIDAITRLQRLVGGMGDVYRVVSLVERECAMKCVPLLQSSSGSGFGITKQTPES